MSNFFSRLQQLGRALMLPIAVLPIAGWLRLGQPDVLGGQLCRRRRRRVL
jgi:PTS system N-acetylglucosamine-specific IIC component